MVSVSLFLVCFQALGNPEELSEVIKLHVSSILYMIVLFILIKYRALY